MNVMEHNVFFAYALCKEVRGYSALSESGKLATDSTTFTYHHTYRIIHRNLSFNPSLPKKESHWDMLSCVASLLGAKLLTNGKH